MSGRKRNPCVSCKNDITNYEKQGSESKMYREMSQMQIGISILHKNPPLIRKILPLS